MYKILLLAIISINCYADEKADSEKLKTELYKITQTSHRPITYKQANDILFTKLDNHNGSVCSVYSPSTCVVTNIVPSPKVMNIEHTWPQSEGANGDAKSDLHHIFPVDSSVNSIRSSLPFCEVVTVKWENGQSKRGISKFNEHCFEPPADHKGDVARALFYFSVRYRQPIDQNQEYFLRKWHLEDPIDQKEIDRNQSIKEFQNNSNPFIDNPELVSKIIDF
jgi:hypothetical protein